MEKLKVLIVDDAPLFISVMQKVLSSFKEVEIVGTANDGIQALRQILLQKPDLVTLDIEMPRMTGIEVLEKLKTSEYRPDIIMISAQSRQCANITMQCLRMGAYDFISKPEGISIEDSIHSITGQLQNHVRLLHAKKMLNAFKHEPQKSQAICSCDEIQPLNSQIKLVTIASSTGGPTALREVLKEISGSFPAPIVITQHMPPVFTNSLAESINRECKLEVKEALIDHTLKKGEVVIARGGGNIFMLRDNYPHLLQTHFVANEGTNHTSFSPNSDHLLNSIPETLLPNTVSIVLTGMGADGSKGAKRVYDAGGTVIAQDALSCVVNGMPAATINLGAASYIVQLENIGKALNKLAGL